MNKIIKWIKNLFWWRFYYIKTRITTEEANKGRCLICHASVRANPNDKSQPICSDYSCPCKWGNDIPAWSLHRLMEIAMRGDKLGCITHNIHQNNVATYYELVISSIEHLIKIDEFNKDYLEEK